jgi:hypothetical protein
MRDRRMIFFVFILLAVILGLAPELRAQSLKKLTEFDLPGPGGSILCDPIPVTRIWFAEWVSRNNLIAFQLCLPELTLNPLQRLRKLGV